MNWEVDKLPTLPRMRSPLKNSKINLPILYRIRYMAPTCPSAFFLFANQTSTRKCRKFKPLEINCVGNKLTPFGA